MPLLALGASELLMLAVLVAIGGGALWLVGHVVEEDIHELGEVIPKILNPGVIIAVLAITYLVTRKGK